MSTPKLSDFKAIIFDIYGTLTDVRSGVLDQLSPLVKQFPSVNWSDEELWTVYDSVEHNLQAQYPEMGMSELLVMVYQTLEARLHALSGKDPKVDTLDANLGTSSAEASTSSATPTSESSVAASGFGTGVKSYPLFSDSPEALRRLAKHYKLTALTNMDHVGVENTIAKLSTGTNDPTASQLDEFKFPETGFWYPRETLGGEKTPFTLIVTASDVKMYKPQTGGFRILLQHLADKNWAAGESDVLSVAQSLAHDHIPAHSLGLHSVWIDRQKKGPEYAQSLGAKYDWRFESLEEFADALENGL